jgi:hypothetical protein
MTLKVTLKIDPEHGGEVIALLAKAFSRKELGIEDVRIERWATGVDPRVEESVTALIRRPVKPKSKRSGYALGMRAMKSGKPNGVVATLIGLSHDASRDGLLAMWKARGLNSNGLSATLSKLQKRGYVTNVAAGVWRLTPQGQEFVKQWRQTHDHANGE